MMDLIELMKRSIAEDERDRDSLRRRTNRDRLRKEERRKQRMEKMASMELDRDKTKLNKEGYNE